MRTSSFPRATGGHVAGKKRPRAADFCGVLRDGKGEKNRCNAKENKGERKSGLLWNIH